MILSSTKEYENKRNGDSVRLKRRPLAIGRRGGKELLSGRTSREEGKEGKKEHQREAAGGGRRSAGTSRQTQGDRAN